MIRKAVTDVTSLFFRGFRKSILIFEVKTSIKIWNGRGAESSWVLNACRNQTISTSQQTFWFVSLFEKWWTKSLFKIVVRPCTFHVLCNPIDICLQVAAVQPKIRLNYSQCFFLAICPNNPVFNFRFSKYRGLWISNISRFTSHCSCYIIESSRNIELNDE